MQVGLHCFSPAPEGFTLIPGPEERCNSSRESWESCWWKFPKLSLERGCRGGFLGMFSGSTHWHGHHGVVSPSSCVCPALCLIDILCSCPGLGQPDSYRTWTHTKWTVNEWLVITLDGPTPSLTEYLRKHRHRTLFTQRIHSMTPPPSMRGWRAGPGLNPLHFPVEGEQHAVIQQLRE